MSSKPAIMVNLLSDDETTPLQKKQKTSSTNFDSNPVTVFIIDDEPTPRRSSPSPFTSSGARSVVPETPSVVSESPSVVPETPMVESYVPIVRCRQLRCSSSPAPNTKPNPNPNPSGLICLESDDEENDGNPKSFNLQVKNNLEVPSTRLEETTLLEDSSCFPPIPILEDDLHQIFVKDVWKEYTGWPLNDMENQYKFMAKHVQLWSVAFHGTSPRWIHGVYLAALAAFYAKEVEAGLMEYKPDIIINVHPLMQHIPLLVLKWQGLQKKVIFVTVITDLNTCYRTWFHPGVKRCYCPSEEVSKRALLGGLEQNQVRVFVIALSFSSFICYLYEVLYNNFFLFCFGKLRNILVSLPKSKPKLNCFYKEYGSCYKFQSSDLTEM